ncbi:hypothetical protein DXG01_003038 [Tephrocybe rancida]|nr:hypothetical protein DXG01_003038 [Tephrocybe rancida]
MNYGQVTELNLLALYLDLLEIEDIIHLADGKGTPPDDDPQTYLGSVLLANEDKDEARIASSPIFPSPLSSLSTFPSLSLNSISLDMHHGSFRGGARGCGGSRTSPDPRAHPWLSQDHDTQDIILAVPGKDRESIPVHQIKGYIAFDRAIRDSSEKAARRLIVPLGYRGFSKAVNKVPHRVYPYRFVSWNHDLEQWDIPARPIKANVVSTGYLDPRYHDLLVLGLLTAKGEVNTRVLQDINSALRRPHGEQVKQTMFYHLRQEERLLSASYSDDDDGISNYLSDGGPSNTTHTPAPTPVVAHAPVVAPTVPNTIAPGSAATTADPEIDPRDVDTPMGPINSNLGELQDYNDEE